MIKKIIVDGTSVNPSTRPLKYIFENPGEHNVHYLFEGSTIEANDLATVEIDTLEIPSTIKTIAAEALNNAHIKNIIFKGSTPPTINGELNIPSTTKIYVPAHASVSYSNALGNIVLTESPYPSDVNSNINVGDVLWIDNADQWLYACPIGQQTATSEPVGICIKASQWGYTNYPIFIGLTYLTYDADNQTIVELTEDDIIDHLDNPLAHNYVTRFGNEGVFERNYSGTDSQTANSSNGDNVIQGTIYSLYDLPRVGTDTREANDSAVTNTITGYIRGGGYFPTDTPLLTKWASYSEYVHSLNNKYDRGTRYHPLLDMSSKSGQEPQLGLAPSPYLSTETGTTCNVHVKRLAPDNEAENTEDPAIKNMLWMWNGKENSDGLHVLSKDYYTHPAADICYNYNPTSRGMRGAWYMPSVYELALVVARVDLLDQVLLKLRELGYKVGLFITERRRRNSMMPYHAIPMWTSMQMSDATAAVVFPDGGVGGGYKNDWTVALRPCLYGNINKDKTVIDYKQLSRMANNQFIKDTNIISGHND